MNKHTLGPWVLYIREPELNNGYVSVESDTGLNIMVENLYRSDRDEVVANARLIAAAPELLESLTKCVEIMSNGGTWTLEDQHDARDAIAKATAGH